MKNVTYKKRNLVNNGRVVSVREQFSDSDCATRVMKNFVYLVSRADEIPETPETPQIRVTKDINSQAKTETFVFKVKGTIHVKEKRMIYRVQYCHSLVIHMFWKTHVLSSDPAALA